MTKTNAPRLLEGAGIVCEARDYDVSDGRIDALSIAAKIGIAPEACFKTLVTVNPERDFFVFVVPADAELDLKKAARASRSKSIAMIPQKQLLPATGYVHGGCSPVGMKKAFPTFLEESALLCERISVSAGRIGTVVLLEPEKLASFLGAEFADLV
ncbi:MAG: Cys-tRNA(Pro) deacylase [Victivallaceae bacterium]|nr:Cys-tRNA(Pro) deacylase [Victivallaceae bacterium]